MKILKNFLMRQKYIKYSDLYKDFGCKIDNSSNFKVKLYLLVYKGVYNFTYKLATFCKEPGSATLIR